MSYIRHSQGTYRRLLRCFLKEIQTFLRLLQQKDCRGTDEVNDAFKLLPRKKDCRQLYSLNSNAEPTEVILGHDGC